MTENNEDKTKEMTEQIKDAEDFIAKLFAPMNVEVNNMKEQTINEEYKKAKQVKEPTLQVRTISGEGIGVMHVQGFGEVTINRDYGFAGKYTMPPDVGAYLHALKATHTSFASDTLCYVRNISVEKYDDGYQLVIDGSNNAVMHPDLEHVFKFNFSNTWRLDVDFKKCSEMIDFVEQNNAYIQCEGKRPTQGVSNEEEE